MFLLSDCDEQITPCLIKFTSCLVAIVISCCDGLSQVDATGLSGAGGDYVESVCARITVLARQLKCLENVNSLCMYSELWTYSGVSI